ncbi:ShlB/FhaC/HecB family hemolysin secretion/activation protein [Chondrinema litorale]|uniref:ShlB/FhaC/HecB family hemolysin secretion/activation protein n=1 Tax=Chondrinema litorale TaxID=2994555 RepID=UPI00254383B7|nr:BamA/TamA family outer membrane protein [Chondrinema litorale]UZR92779.1 BamA/TamA family outer membrane protein [Chondrinema litorale]
MDVSFFLKFTFLFFLIDKIFFLSPLYSQGKFEAEEQLYSFINKEDTLTKNGKNIREYDSTKKTSPLKVTLQVKEIPAELLIKSGYKPDSLGNLKLHSDELLAFKDRIISESENSGHPFASISFINTNILNDEIVSYCKYQAGTLIVFDSLQVYGDVRIKKKFLARYLELTSNSENIQLPFSQKKIDEIKSNIDELPYLSLTKEPNIIFDYDKAVVVLYLKEEKVNSFDGVLGLATNSSSDSKVSLTGQLDFKLYNPFGSGKELLFNWQRVKQASPVYNLGYSHPNFVNSGLDLNFQLNSLQEDSTFRNLSWELGFSQRLTAKSEISFSYLSKSHINLDEESTTLDNLPSGNAKISSKMFGISFLRHTLNNILYPSSGWRANFSVYLGKRKLYLVSTDTLSGENLRYILKADLQKYTTLNRNFTLVNNINFGLIGGAHVYKSEMFRAGGIYSIRGFSENIFFADEFLILNNEIRVNMADQSYLFIFNDIAYIREKYNSSNSIPIGLGAGLNLTIKNGNLLLAFGFGKEDKTSKFFDNSRFHFGYKAIF